MLKDKKVVLGTTGGQAGVLGQQLRQRKGLGAEALRGALSPPSSLQSLLLLHSPKGGRSRGRMSLLLPLPHWPPWVDGLQESIQPQLVLLWDAWDVGQGPRIWPPRLRLQSLSLGTVSAGPQHIPGRGGTAKYLEIRKGPKADHALCKTGSSLCPQAHRRGRH